MIDRLPAHGGQLHLLAKHFGIAESELLDFSANINPDGPPAAVVSALREGIEDLSTIVSYPDLEQNELKCAIARYAGVTHQQLAVANGFVPLLEAALRTLKIRSCLLPVPAFVEYRKTLIRPHVEIAPYILSADRGFSYDADDMMKGKHDAILLANPQNPSGVACSGDEVLSLIGKAAERNIWILLDEAFVDYVPEFSVTRYVDRFPNLIVFRSVTKFHGMPGLRVAYAVANAATVISLNENLPPWPITTLASRAVAAGLGDEAYAVRTRILNQKRRRLLKDAIEALGIHVYPSAANFLLFRLPEPMDADTFWRRMLCEHHIALRSCFNYEGLAKGHLRAAVRTEEENSRFARAIAQLLR